VKTEDTLPAESVATFAPSAEETEPVVAKPSSPPPAADAPPPAPSPAPEDSVIRPMRIIAVGDDEPVEVSARSAALAEALSRVARSPKPPAPEATKDAEGPSTAPSPLPPPAESKSNAEATSPASSAPRTPPPLPKRSATPAEAEEPVEARKPLASDPAVELDEVEEVEEEPATKPSPLVEGQSDDDEPEPESLEEIEPDRISDVPDSGVTPEAAAGAAEAEKSTGPKRPPPPPPPKRGTLPTVPEPAAATAQTNTSAQAEKEKPAPPPPSLDLTRKRQKLWWEELFNDDFIRTMDRPEPANVRKECDFIEDRLGLERGAVILDLACGLGLHTVELASRGYSVVGYDLSLAMLAHAADEAQERGQKLNFLHGDMREMAFEDTFDGVYCWSMSFGYFDDEKNLNVLSRIHRALRKGGMLLLDITNRDYIAPRQPSLVWFEGDGCVCMDEMSVDFFSSRLKVKRTVMFDDGRSREIDYSIRLYALHELGKMLHESGFKVVEVTGHPAHPGVFFGSESPRLIVLAERDDG